jgi:hypothetical protein
VVRNCKIFLSTSPSLISRIIRRVRGTRWSHTGILIDDCLTLEATFKGLEIRRWAPAYRDNPKVRYRVYALHPSMSPLQETFDRAVERNIRIHVGVNYAYVQLLGFLWVWAVNRLFGKKIQNPLRDGGGRKVCTEDVAEILIESGKNHKTWAEWMRPRILNADMESLGPDDIEKWMEEGVMFKWEASRE